MYSKLILFLLIFVVQSKELLGQNKLQNSIRSEVYCTQTELDPFYTGWAVQLCQSQRPISSKNSLLQKFGNLKYLIQDDGSYKYYFLATFSDSEGALQYFEQVIAPLNKEALLVYFQKGKLKKTYIPQLLTSK